MAEQTGKILRIGAYVVGLALLAGSIWFALRGQDASAWQVVTRAPPTLLLTLALAVLLSGIVLPALQFWVATAPFVTGEKLQPGTMQLLLAASALLNYTPFKAGLIGRVGYLRYFHGVSLRAAVLTHVVLGGVFLTTSVISLAITLWRPPFGAGWLALAALSLIAVLAVGIPLLRMIVRVSAPEGRQLTASLRGAFLYLLASFLLQGLTLLCTAWRWWLAFRVANQPISLPEAWLNAIVHLTAVTLGPANGLGLREWLIGITSTQGWLVNGLQMPLGTGMMVALIDRSVEAVVVISLGSLSLFLLRRRWALARSAGNGP